MSFFKPPVFGKTVLIFCALFSALLFNSCKQLASFDPNVDGARVVVSNTFSAPTGVKATQGRKQKISLEWTPVSGAKYYDIYCAESATAEFNKIHETVKNSFDDTVPAGSTLYYKVCAIKSNGTQSAFSTTVKGTSLAQPVISGGDADDSSVTISWFMENARGIDGKDNYENLLVFEVCYQQKNGGTEIPKVIPATEFANSSYEYTFTDLAGSSEYQFYVKAYLSTDQQNSEQSPKVTKETLTSYTPLAPEFTASQGESAQGIWLFITLPEKVMVQTETTDSQGEKVDEPYPLKFEIFRKVGDKDSGGNWEEVCVLYYNGTELTKNPVDYQKDGAPYEAGKQVNWFDESANLVGGEKYTYRIISRSDTENYDKVVCPGKKNNSIPTPPNKATTALGWKSAHPDFKVNCSADSRTLSDDNTKVLSYEFDFSADWNDLGKAENYKFAIKQNRKPLDENYSGEGDGIWLTNASDEIFFGTIDEINERRVKFGSESGLSDEEIGVYSYTLYVVLKDAESGDVTDGGEKVLDSVKAIDEIVVTDVVKLPNAKLEVKGGYRDHVVLKVEVEQNVTYKVIRTRLDTTPQEVTEFEIDPQNPNDVAVEGNGKYSYVLKAIDNESHAFSLSQSQEAETLGTPTVSFEKGSLSYDSVTISFAGVLAANKYTVQFSETDDFGGGETFEITKENDEWNSVATGSRGASAVVVFNANKFTVTIQKPYGYNDATLAGRTTKATVTAHSEVGDTAESEAVDVNVFGPALLDAKVSADITENSISLSWNKVDDAKGYLIRRVMYDDAEMTGVAEESGITYYYDGEKVTYDGEDTGDRVEISESAVEGKTRFTLTDNYKKVDSTDANLESYQKAQAKISWGLPFRYVVLPVLNKSDFDFNADSLALAGGGKVAYTNLGETDPAATYGYGLEVHAEKSKSTEKQTITWKKPYYASQTEQKPYVFRRKAETADKFVYVKDANAGVDSFTYTPEGDDRYEAFEYAVKYTLVDECALPDSLNTEFAQTMDSESKTEPRNKGYLFTVKDSLIKSCELSATQGGSNEYAERITWNSANVRAAWGDYDKRALGPTGVRLYIWNNNLEAKWHLAADIASLDYSGEVTSNSEKDVSAEKGTEGICLYPASIADGSSSGTTSGALKVLRDYKHYYAIALTRENKNDEGSTYVETQKYTPGFDDFAADAPVYAYRQITDEELVKTTMLTLADMEQDSGMENQTTGGSWSLIGANDGTFTGSGNGGTKLTWSIDNYQHKWRKLPSGQTNVPSFITLNDTGNNVRGRKFSAYLVYLCNGVSGTNDFSADKLIPLTVKSDVYGEAIVHFATGTDEQKTGWFGSTKTQRFIVKVERNGSTTFTKEVEGEENCRYWCPITWYKSGGIGTQSGTGYFGEDSTYGWWPSSSN